MSALLEVKDEEGEEEEEEEEGRRGKEEPVLFCQKVVLVSASSVVEGEEEDEGVEKKGMGKRKEREASRPRTGRRSCSIVGGGWEGGRERGRNKNKVEKGEERKGMTHWSGRHRVRSCHNKGVLACLEQREG